MANENKYVLKLDFSDLQGVVNDIKPRDNQGATNESAQKIGKFFKAQVIQPFIRQSVNIVTTNINVISGQEEMAQRWNTMLGSVAFGQQIYTNIAGGIAFAGTVGLSAVAGAGIGVAVLALQKGLDYVGESVRINSLRQVEDRQISQLQQRSGYIFNKSRQGA